MPIFEVEAIDKRFKVDAPNIIQARDGEDHVSNEAVIWPHQLSGTSELEIYRNG
jgi:hypothetical protein